MGTTQWHYVLAKTRERHGPVDDGEFQALIAAGAVSPLDYVWRAGMPDWARAETVADLAALFNREDAQGAGLDSTGPSLSLDTPPHGLGPMTIPDEEEEDVAVSLDTPEPEAVPPTPVHPKKARHTTRVMGAGLWRRTMAFAFDLVLLLLVEIIGMYCMASLNYLDFNALNNTLEGPGLIMDYLLSIVWVLYLIAFEASKRQATLGKQLAGLKVATLHGGRPGFLRVFNRNLFKIVSLSLFPIGLLFAFFTKRRQTLHDLLSGCVVAIDLDRIRREVIVAPNRTHP